MNWTSKRGSKMKRGTKFKQKDALKSSSSAPVKCSKQRSGKNSNLVITNHSSQSILIIARQPKQEKRGYDPLKVILMILCLQTATKADICRDEPANQQQAINCANQVVSQAHNHHLPDKVSKLVDMMVSGPLNQSESSRLLAVGRDTNSFNHEAAALIIENYNKKHLRRSKQLRKLLSRPGSLLSSIVPQTNPTTGQRVLQQPDSLVRNLRRLHNKLHSGSGSGGGNIGIGAARSSNSIKTAQANLSLNHETGALVAVALNPYGKQRPRSYLPLAQQAPLAHPSRLIHRDERPRFTPPERPTSVRPTMQALQHLHHHHQQQPQKLPVGREQKTDQRARQVVLLHSLPPPIQSSFSIETPGEVDSGEEEEDGPNENSEPDETEHNLSQVDSLIKREFENRLNFNEQLINRQRPSDDNLQPTSNGSSANQEAQSEVTSSTTSPPEVFYLDTTKPTTEFVSSSSDWQSNVQVSSGESPAEIDFPPNLLIKSPVTMGHKDGGYNTFAKSPDPAEVSLRAQYTRDAPLTTRFVNSGVTVIAGEPSGTDLLANDTFTPLFAKPFEPSKSEKVSSLLKMVGSESVNQTANGMSFTIDNKSSLLRPTALTSVQRVANPQVLHLALQQRHKGANGVAERQVKLRAPSVMTLLPAVIEPSASSAERQVKLTAAASHPLHPVNQHQVRQQQQQQQQQQEIRSNTQSLSMPILVYDNDNSSDQQRRQQYRAKINQNNIDESPATGISSHEHLGSPAMPLNPSDRIGSTGSSQLSETLKRLRETKAKIKQLQAEINATNPNLLLVSAVVAGNNSSSNGINRSSVGSAPERVEEAEQKTTSEGLLSAMMSLLPLSGGSSGNGSSSSSAQTGDLFRFWPIAFGGSTNGSVLLKGGTVIQAQDSMNLPMGMYHNGPLTAPARLVASAFGRAAQSSLANHFPITPATQWSLSRLAKNPMGLQVVQSSTSSTPVLLGSTLTVAGNDQPPTTPIPLEEGRSSSTRRPYSWPLPEKVFTKEPTMPLLPVTGRPSSTLTATKLPSTASLQPPQIRAGNSAKLAPPTPPHTMAVEFLTGGGQQPGMSGESFGGGLNQWPTRHFRYQQQQQQQKPKSDDKSSTLMPKSGLPAAGKLPDQSLQSTLKPSPTAGNTDTTTTTTTTTTTSPPASTIYLTGKPNQNSGSSRASKQPTVQFPPESINAILDDELFGGPADKRDVVENVGAAAANQPEPGNFISRLFARLVDSLPIGQVTSTSGEPSAAHNLTAAQLNLIDNSTDGKLTTERILHVLIYATCSAALLCLLAVLAILRCNGDPSRKCTNERGNLNGFRSSGGLYQLDWRRFALGSTNADANQRQQHDKLIHDGTMHNVSLLARHQTSGKQVALNSGQVNQASGIVSAPLRNQPCCHCATCSSSPQQRADKNSGSQCQQQQRQQQQQPALCYASLYQQGPRGKLPFGAASSVNKFLNQFNRKSANSRAKIALPAPATESKPVELGAKQHLAGRGPIGGTRLRMMSAIDERTSPSFAALPMTTGRCEQEVLDEDVSVLRCTCNLYAHHHKQQQVIQQEQSSPRSGCSANSYLMRHHHHHHQQQQQLRSFSPVAAAAAAATQANQTDSSGYNGSKSGGSRTNENCDFNELDNENSTSNNKRCNCDKSLNLSTCTNLALCGVGSDRLLAAALASGNKRQHRETGELTLNGELQQRQVKQQNLNCSNSNSAGSGQFDSIRMEEQATSAKHGANCESVACGCCELRANYHECYGRQLMSELNHSAAAEPSTNSGAKAVLPSPGRTLSGSDGSANSRLSLRGSAAAGAAVHKSPRNKLQVQHQQQQVANTGVYRVRQADEIVGVDLERKDADEDQDGEEEDEAEDDGEDEDDDNEEEEDLNDSGCCPHDMREIEEPTCSSGADDDQQQQQEQKQQQQHQVKTAAKGKRTKGKQRQKEQQRTAKMDFLTSPLSLAATFRRKLRRTLIDVNERHQQQQVKQKQQQQDERLQIEPSPVSLSPNRHQATQKTNPTGAQHHEIHANRPKSDVVVEVRASQDTKKLLGCGQEQFKSCCDRFDNVKL